MQVLKLTLLTAACACAGLASPTPALASGDPAASSSVTVVVSALASTSSTVKLYFYNVREKFLTHGGYAFMRVVKPAGQKQVSLPVDLSNGEWAVVITQDTNNNDKLDKNFMGIPTEPFAFSNNVRPRLAPPGFDDCKFTVSSPGKVVNIALTK